MKIAIERAVVEQVLEALDVYTNPRKLQREAITTLRAALEAATKVDESAEPFGYWFPRERRFATLDEGERYFDSDERAELLIPLYTHPAPAVPVSGKTSDGYHTFNELYEHRHALFIKLMRSNPSISWRANNHEDGTMFSGGWFIAGMHLPTGDISYHLPSVYWESLDGVGIATSNKSPKWDGHTADDVVRRLNGWCNNTAPAVPQAPEGVTYGEPVPWDVYANLLIEVAAMNAEKEGWQLVPKEPTIEMYNAWDNHNLCGYAERYKAMLQAAPEPTK